MSKARNAKVFLCGEGSNELGSRFGDAAYQSDERPGVLHALLVRVQPTGWEIGGVREWKRIRKYRRGGPQHKDTHNVLGAALDAKEAGCDVLAFSRDCDRDAHRRDAIEEGIRMVPSTLPSAPAVIGGVAIPTLEGWILALLQELRTEEFTPRRAEQKLEQKGVKLKVTEAMVRVVEEADLSKVPSDATSLAAWIARARNVLPPLVEKLAKEN
ncbi:MAG: hypothetical protein HUU21_31525 [Polyangiaceae bacterium]|nr:hypothetical protein [Polyangiaceae bacterium]